MDDDNIQPSYTKTEASVSSQATTTDNVVTENADNKVTDDCSTGNNSHPINDKPILNKRQLVTLIALVAMSAISTDLYLSGLPQMIEDFNSTHSAVQLTLSIFLLGLAIGQVITGSLSDQYGRLPVLKLGLVLYIVSSIGCLLVNTIEGLWIGRFVQGFSASCGPVLARAIVSDLFKRKDAAKILAYLSSAMALIPALAPIIGSIALIWFDWKSHFVLLAIFGIILLIAVLLLLPETSKNSQQKSFIEGIRSIVSNIGNLLKDKIFIGYVVCGSIAHGAMFAYISSSSYLISGLLEIDPKYFGYTFTVNVIGYIIGAFASAKMVSKVSIVRLLNIGLILLSIVVVLLIFQLTALQNSVSLIGLLFSMMLVFMAGGFLIANAQAAAITRFREYAGSASAVFGFIQISTAALCGALAGLFYNNSILPLTIIIALCTLVGFATWYLLLYQSDERTKIHG